MLQFLVSFAVVFAGLFAWGYGAEQSWMRYQAHSAFWLAALLIGVPTLCAWLVAEALDKLAPRRAFDARVRKPWTLMFAGVAGALVSVVLATPLITLVPRMNDGVSLGVAALSGTTLVLAILRGKRRGACVHCGYDLAGAPEPRCPECGAMHSVVGPHGATITGATAAR